MFWKEWRGHRKETRFIKDIPLANEKIKNNSKKESKIDRRRAIALKLAPFLVLGGLVLTWRNNNMNDDEKSVPSITSKTIVIGEDGYCDYPNMTTNPAETRVLQYFLAENNFYNGELNGEYSEETSQAVAEFQQVAKAEGRYDVIIDGIAEYYTCMAMGEPYFVFED